MHLYMHFQMHKGPFSICVGEILDLNWGGLILGGGIIVGRIRYVQM